MKLWSCCCCYEPLIHTFLLHLLLYRCLPLWSMRKDPTEKKKTIINFCKIIRALMLFLKKVNNAIVIGAMYICWHTNIHTNVTRYYYCYIWMYLHHQLHVSRLPLLCRLLLCGKCRQHNLYSSHQLLVPFWRSHQCLGRNEKKRMG